MPLLKKWSLRTTKKPQKQKRYPWSPCRVRHGQRLLPRHGHTVVVHATLGLLVYGGIHKAKKDVVCIDPVTLNTRILTTSGSRPSSRIHATTTLFGNYLYLYGGQCLDPSLPWDTNLYILNLESQRWTVMQTMRGIGARAGHTMVASHGMAYIWGGKRPDGSLVNEMCVFALHRGLQGDWDTIHLDYKPVARSHHCAVVSERNMFMFGGSDGNRCFNDLWCFDLAQHAWALVNCTGFIPSPRQCAAAVAIDGVIYIFGGKDQAGHDLQDLFGYRIKDRKWYMFQNMGIPPSPRHDHVFAAVGRRLFVVGGRTAREDKDDQDIMHYLDHGIITYPKSENESAIVPRASSSMPVPRSGKQALEKHRSTSPRSSGSVLTVEPSTSVSASAKAPIRTISPIRSHSLGASSHISRQGSLRVRRDMISPLQQLIDNTTSNLKNPQVPQRQLSGSSRVIVASPSPATTPIPGPLSHNEDDEEDFLLPATLMMNDDDNTSGTGSGLRRDSAYPSSLVVHDLPERKTPQHVQQQKQAEQDDHEMDQEQKSHENDHGQEQEHKNHENDAVDASLDVSLSDTPEDLRPRTTAHDSTQPLESKVTDASFLPAKLVQQLPQSTEMDTVPQPPTVHAPGQAPMAQNEADELDDATREELLAQIRERDEIIKSMKNTEHWWRTQVSKARGLAPPAPTTKTGVATDESSTKNAQYSLSTGNGDDDAMDAHPDIQLLTFPDDDTPGQSKRLFFEQLIRAKSQARRIRRDIYLTCKPISSKLDHDQRIQQAALEEAKHYKTLCAAILFHRHHSLTSTATNTSTSKTSSTANANANEKEPDHHLDAVMRTSGASHASSLTSGAVDLLEHEMDRRMVRLDQQLQTLLDLGSYTRDRLAVYKDQAEANAQVKSMLTRQVDRGHQKAVFYQDMYESLLKQMLALQRATMQHQFATIRNKYQHKLLQHQMASVQQFDPQPEIRHSLASMSIASGDTTTSSSHRRDSHEPYLDADGWNDLLTHWKAKNKHQQGTIDQLREQLIVSTEVIHQLRMDLICKTNDWRSTLVQLEKVKADIHQLRRTAASSLP